MQEPSPDAEELFFAALELKSSEARASFLARHCEDTVLRREVEALLSLDARASDFLEAPAAMPTMTAPHDSGSGVNELGAVIGPYKLREQLGEGGMGIVYVAEQREPVRRKVALKVIKPGMDNRQVVARFEAERQALAMMDHPNIARVFDGGTTPSGRPYFVMELVRGLPITDYCDQEQLPIRDRLELFVLVCRAVQHAHQKGIIHRDLKPSNILVTLHDGLPVPKVIDFGIAKATGQSLTEKTVYTAFAQLIGTPLYMSPEQVEISGLDVDTRSDIYSMGVLLYELLTGTTPFDQETLRKAAFDEMRRIIREEEPPRPSTRLSSLGSTRSNVSANRKSEPRRLDRAIRGELDWIVMRALEKDRKHRYETANDFAADVMRYLTDKPVQACPPSASYRFRKFARRNRTALTTCALVTATLVIGTGVSAWQALRATRAEWRAEGQRELAEGSAEEARRQATEARKAQSDTLRAKQDAERHHLAVSQNLYYADMRLGLADWAAGNIGRLSSNLLSHAPRVGEEDQRGWEWYYLLALCHQDERTLMQHANYVESIDWSPDGRYLASTDRDMLVTVYDATTWKTLRTWHGHQTFGAHWSPDSQRLAWATHGPENGLYVGHVEKGEISSLPDHGHSGTAPAWSPDGKRLASRGMSGIRVWDPVTGSSTAVSRGEISIGAMAWDLGGKLQVLARDGQLLVTWDAVSGEGSRAVPSMTGMSSAAWSPDGKRLALGMEAGKCQVYNSTDWSLAHEWDAHTGPVHAVAWRPGGTQLASAGADHLVRVWDPATGRELRTHRGHLNQVVALAWEPNGRRLASAGMDGLVKVWSLSSAPQPLRLEGHAGGLSDLAWSSDGETLRSLGAGDGVNALWSAVSGRCLAKTPVGRGISGRFSPGGRLLAIARDDENKPEIFIHDAAAGELVQTVKSAKIIARLTAFSPDASKLALSDGLAVEIVDLRQGGPQVRWESRRFRALSWSPDGRLLSAAGHGDPGPSGREGWGALVHVFDTEKHQRLLKLQHGASWVPVTAVTWSPNGQRLVSGDPNGLVEIWDVPASRKVASAQLHAAAVNALAWSPDGRRVASGTVGGAVLVWDPIRGEELLRLDAPKCDVTRLEWSPNGRRLAGATADGAILIWDATAGYEFIQSEAYLFEQIRHALNHASRLWQAGRKAEAGAAIVQTLDANKLRLDSIPRWVGMSLCDAGLIRNATVQDDEAIRLYQLITSLLKDGTHHRVFGLAFKNRGQRDQAAVALREAARLHKDDVITHTLLGDVLAQNGQLDQAIASFREVVRNRKQSAYAHTNLAHTLMMNGQLDDAITSYREAIRIHRNNPQGHYWLGNALLENGQLDDAITSYREAIRIDPGFHGAYKELGDALQARGRLEEAIASFREAIRIDKGGDAVEHAKLGSALQARGRLEEAIASFREAIRIDKNLADAHSDLGISLLAGGRAEDAIATLREAVRLKKSVPAPPNENSWYINFGANTLECDLINLGNALHTGGRAEEAIDCYREALQGYQRFVHQRPRRAKVDPAPQRIMAWFLATCPEPKFRDVAKAVDLAKTAVKLAPSACRAQSVLGVCLYRAGDWNAAIEALEKAGRLRKGGDSDDGFFRAMAHWQLGQRDDARKWYDQAVRWMDRTQPRNPELRRFHREAEELMGVNAPRQ